MPLVIPKELPRYETLKEAAREYPDMDPSAVEAYLHVIRTGDLVVRLAETALARHRISQGGFGVLTALLRSEKENASAGPPTLSALAERTGVTPATMTGVIDTLEGDGLVQRGADPHDRRKVVVVLSPKGRDLLTQVMPGHLRFIAGLLRPLSRSERGELVGLLRKIVARADDSPTWLPVEAGPSPSA